MMNGYDKVLHGFMARPRAGNDGEIITAEGRHTVAILVATAVSALPRAIRRIPTFFFL
jgi:hypothetical protein